MILKAGCTELRLIPIDSTEAITTSLSSFPLLFSLVLHRMKIAQVVRRGLPEETLILDLDEEAPLPTELAVRLKPYRDFHRNV